MKAASKPEKVTTVEGITEYRLSNGLCVLLLPDRTRSTITVNITYKVGSRHEGYGETGMAHLLEHLMFKGSPKHPNIPQELTAHGARSNATTSYDRTNYFETFQATDENSMWALDLEADRMVNSFIAKEGLDSEMTVVRNELETGENDLAGVLRERVLSTAYLWHAYGRTTIGARSDIENVRIERLRTFWKTYYQPDNAVLILTGRFDEEKALGWISEAFGKIPRPTRELPRTYTVEPSQDGEREVVLRRPSDVQEVFVAYHVPAAAHPDAAAVKFLISVLGHEPSGRLHKALVETGKAASVSSSCRFLCEPGLFMAGATVRKGSSLEEARDVMLATLDGVIENPPSEEEVERARTKLLGSIELTLRSSQSVGLFLSEWIGVGDWRLLFLDRERIRKVTPEDVRRVAAAYLKPSNRTVGRLIPVESPDRAEIPAAPDLAILLEGYEGGSALASGEAFDPSPSNIESRTTRSQLSGGLRLALLPKSTRGGAVVASMTLRYGDEKTLVNRRTAAQLAGGMLLSGTAKHTRQQIKDEFDRLKARVAMSGHAVKASLSVTTTRENFSSALTLVAECLRESSFPASEFDQLKEEMIADFEAGKREPNQIAVTAFYRHVALYPKADVRYIPTPDEEIVDIKATSLEDARNFYADFYGASVGELVVVGDFDANEVGTLAQQLFGAWKSPQAYTRVPGPYRDVAVANTSFEAPDKANAFFIAGLNLAVRNDDSEYPGLVLGNYMLGDGFLNSRLAVRIREKDGLSYSVSSQLEASSFDRSGIFGAFASCAPQNTTKVEAAFKEEIARALEDGFEEREMEEAKSGWLQEQQVARAHDLGLAHTLARNLFLERTLAFDADFEKKVQALTAAQVLGALRKHIDPAKISTFKAGDFARVAATPPVSGPIPKADGVAAAAH